MGINMFGNVVVKQSFDLCNSKWCNCDYCLGKN